MDSLTARLMSRSGLNPVDPTLPPVHNMRVVYLNEKFGDAEEALHDARLALEALETVQKTKPYDQTKVDTAADKVYDAMAKLAVKERDYFANRYFGRDKAVLKGWNVDWKQKLFAKTINNMVLTSNAEENTTKTNAYHNAAKSAASLAHGSSLTLRIMNNKWYAAAGGGRQTRTPGTFGADLKLIQDQIPLIRTHLRTAQALPETDARKTDSLTSIRASLLYAETCQRLARLVVNNRWDLPDDLREKPPTHSP